MSETQWKVYARRMAFSIERLESISVGCFKRKFTSVLRSCLGLSTIRRLVRSKKSKESEKTVRIGQLSETGAADLCLLYNLDAIKSDISGGAVYRDSTKSASATGRVR
ncbi:uncharacterized protein LOC118449326 [Vespa mandarinia]|uniref:uncharacterized protein LOC118449326 n=1 Tax=Vespa mandarinia TaxID=7446 RepID=UPI00161C6684|nr:uncharacterized protein LOC118449326 [Vespa mandarinia]